MNSDIFFSIGIPAYKGIYLEDCIKSILCQTCKNFELIIVNDCSPDPIDELVELFTDRRIRYYKNEKNTGAEQVVENWNKCLQYAIGDFFILMGDDDRLEPDYLAEFLNLINQYPDLDIYHCRSVVINENSEPVKYTWSCPQYESTYDYIWHCLSLKRNQYVSDFVYRTEALRGIGGFFRLPLAWATDYLTAFIISGEKGIAHTHLILLNYRQSSYNITSTASIDLKRSAMVQFEHWLENFLQKEPVHSHDKVIYPLLKISYLRAKTGFHVDFIRDKVRVEGVGGFIRCFIKKDKYCLNLKDFIAFTMSLIH